MTNVIKFKPGVGGEIRNFLDGLTNNVDVQEYVRTHQFGKSYINEDSDNWSHYRDAMAECTKRICEYPKSLI